MIVKPQKGLDIARKYVNEHGFSVIPLGYKDKNPAIKWTEYQKRKPTDLELEKWFNNGKKHNIGIVTGIAVVDMDTPEAVQMCKDLEIPETPLVKTANGYHAYYRFKDGVRNVQCNPMFQGIDIRGEGGYVVAPPSIHNSGHVYQWCEGKGLADLSLAEFPEVFLNKGKSGETKKLKDLYRGVCEGSRNQSLARLCGSWASDGLTIEEAMEMAETWNQKNNPPMEDGELRQTVESIFRKHETRGHGNNSGAERLTMGLTSASDLLDEPEETTDWLVEGLLPSGGLSIITAKPKVGKSTLTKQVALNITRGEPFLGRPVMQGARRQAIGNSQTPEVDGNGQVRPLLSLCWRCANRCH